MALMISLSWPGPRQAARNCPTRLQHIHRKLWHRLTGTLPFNIQEGSGGQGPISIFHVDVTSSSKRVKEFEIIWMQLLLGQVASRTGTGLRHTEGQIHFDYPMLFPMCTVIHTTISALKNLRFKKRDKCFALMKKGWYSHYSLLIFPIAV